MLITEEVTIKDEKFVKNYSDRGLFIERDGVMYEEAVDPIEYKDSRIYTETDKPIEEVNTTSSSTVIE
ncbi:hypothetical protein [Eubacterium sp.]|uniref:hypothetical protein n=1 Tax=Eubacterium sp. TaxID=142586 RepID=UPI001D528827|nr:hypothetical protein [Eubacterium sp.]MBS5619692.1 hypothetical protein [Eubacterium sp.]